MRKDIKIPEVKNVYIAAVNEFNDEFKTYDWNAYIINDNDKPLETVIIVSQGYDSEKMTAPMRKTIKLLPAKGYAKIEFLEENVLKVNNFFTITYFIDDKLYDKRFEIPANAAIEDNAVSLPVMKKDGVLAR
ncbi:hypothetical protein [Marixanthomonas spongiae]|uniref:Phenylalanyl-tRNA synthetase subunit alpha n=1 Tax=Marixanthomonas spongiae TaxID=2174845 RepID=A0A2U0I2D5_9FLAO|nr:hypothetical protein [Marixanthomonas spongiae]PVW15281.1 hypothetical protein DDV96_07725 [Marixanthomonas spongiae]